MKKRTFGTAIRVAASLSILAGCKGPGLAWGVAAMNWGGLPVQQAPHASATLALTLYGDSWALVTDARPVSLGSGDQIVRFPGVPSQTDDRNAYLQIPARVDARRFRYDLKTRDKLLEQYHGSIVEIVPKDATGSLQATLLMTDTGPVYKIGDTIYPEPPGKVALPDRPDLATDPTLEWIAAPSNPWSGVATASYVANQLGWQSEYTLVTDRLQTRGEWTHWAAITNRSGAAYRNARVTLVAGDVTRKEHIVPLPMLAGGARAYADTAQSIPAEPYAARYQYVLPEPLTLARGAEERLKLGTRDGVAITRVYRFESAVAFYRITEPELPQKARLRLTIKNTGASGLGLPIPRGKVAVYTPDTQGRLAIAGEPRIPDTPKEQDLILDLGEAFDVTAKRVQTDYRVTDQGQEVAYRITLRNQQDVPVTVELIEQMNGDWTITSSSIPFEKLSTTQAKFTPTVPAGGEVVVTYQASIKKERPQ
ncbi:hypothetical protein J7643_14985 [bacterium]|nr:hypothetical protein [bacterium]